MSYADGFKYHKVDKNLIDGLSRGYLYFPSLEKLNDPLDCRVDLVNVIERATAKSEGKARANLQRLLASRDFLDSIIKKVAEVGVCSFSSGLLKPMMWSHYADEHRGVCLLYKIPDTFINYDKNKIIGRSPVSYGDNILTDSLIKVAENLSEFDAVQIMESLVVPIFTAKGLDWEVEDE